MTKARVKGTDAAKYVRSSAHLKNIEAKVTFFLYNGIAALLTWYIVQFTVMLK